jgi:hypothetical protein
MDEFSLFQWLILGLLTTMTILVFRIMVIVYAPLYNLQLWVLEINQTVNLISEAADRWHEDRMWHRDGTPLA